MSLAAVISVHQFLLILLTFSFYPRDGFSFSPSPSSSSSRPRPRSKRSAANHSHYPSSHIIWSERTTTMPRIPIRGFVPPSYLYPYRYNTHSSSIMNHTTKRLKRSCTSTSDITTSTTMSLSASNDASSEVQSTSASASMSPLASLAQSLIHKKKHRLSFAIAGGGSHAISSLSSSPGASAVLLQGNILYDRNSFCHYISEQLKDKSQSAKELGLGGSYSYTNHLHQFAFASSGAAILASQASLRQSFTLSSSSIHNMMNSNMGVGCTSTLVSHGREDRSSRIHIALCQGHGRGIIINVRLGCEEQESIINDDGMKVVVKRRSRLEEEELMAQLILSSVDTLGEVLADSRLVTKDMDMDWCKDILNRKGDLIEVSTLDLLPSPPISLSSSTSSDASGAIQDAAQRVIDKDDAATDAILVAPLSISSSSSSSSDNTASISMAPLAHSVIPSDPIIFPGSFNPPHIGHLSLANAAVKTMTKKKRTELMEYFGPGKSTGDIANSSSSGSGASSSSSWSSPMLMDMWNTSEYQPFKSLEDDNLENGPFSVLFEMSLTNADKPPMEASEATRRVELFGEMANADANDANDGISTGTSMPQDWGVLLTSAPLFIDKVKTLKRYLSPSYASYSYAYQFNQSIHASERSESSTSSAAPCRQITFVIGTDTMVRIINPKYYDNSYENMLAAAREMIDEGVHFVVGGRVEQIKGTSSDDEGKTIFVTGEEELETLPDDVKSMFTIIKEEDFRVDISSTELRAKNNQ